MKKQKPVLSISMLASDRMDTLPRCLESLTPIREAIPSELIIVDTSKNPEVHELVLKYADKVETFEWCNDFSKARNVGVKLAEGEWFMFLDDDEWFAEPEELIKFFQSGEYKQYGYAHHRIKNFHDPEFKTYSYGWVSRLIKLEKDTMFYSKVHEYLAPYIGADKKILATSYHSGYIFKTEEEKNKHFERNFSLLLKMEEEEPKELRWKVQIMQEYRSVGRWKELAEYGKKTLGTLWAKPATYSVRSFSSLHLGYAIALNQLHRFDEVEEVYNLAQSVVCDTFLAKAYMDECLAESYLGRKMYVEAKDYVNRYLKAYEEYYKNPQMSIEDEAQGLITGNAIDERLLYKAYHLLLCAELGMGNKDKLMEFLPRLGWEKDGAQTFFGTEKMMIDALMELNQKKLWEEVLQKGFSAKTVRPAVMKAILEWKVKDVSKFLELLEVVKTLEIDTWYKAYAGLLTLKEGTEKSEVLVLAKEFITLVPSIFSIPTEIAEVLKGYDIKIADLYRYIDIQEWREALNERLEELQMDQVEDLRKELENSTLVNDVRFYYFMMIYMEQKALVAEKDQLTFDSFTDILALFADYSCMYYETLYEAVLQQTEVEEWPKRYQAAKWLQIFFAEVGNDMKSALGCLAKVIGVYPRLADSMRYYLKRIEIDVLNG